MPYDMLADEEDQKMFYDYLDHQRMLLYFDKFEDELQHRPSQIHPLPNMKQKKTEETEGEGEADELAAEEPASAEEPAVKSLAGEAEAGEEAAAEDRWRPTFRLNKT